MSRIKIYPNSKYPQPGWDEEATPEVVSITEEAKTCNMNYYGVCNNDCDLRYAIVTSFRKNWLYFRARTGIIHLKVALRNNCLYQLGKSTPKELHEGQFILLVGRRVRCKTIIPRASEHHMLELCFSGNVLNEMSSKFPILKTFNVEDEPAGVPVFATAPEYLSPEVLDIIYSLIRSPFEVRKRPFFFRNKFRELLSLILKSVEKDERLKSLDREIKVAERFRTLLLQNIQHPNAVRDLAQKFEMSSARLKQLFKRVFGMSVFNCLLQERMRVAKKMITETTKPVNEIASMVGFKTYRSFSSAYKQYYNCTPTSQRTDTPSAANPDSHRDGGGRQ